MSTNIDRYDAIVIGSGQGGNPLATALAGAGRRTAMIECVHVGGTCINEGCTPTKTMVASARVAYLARRGADYGVRTGEVSVDMARVRERKRAIVDSFRTGGERRLRNAAGLDLLMGRATLTGSDTVAVALNEGGERTLRADTIVINVGGRPSSPPIEGLATVPALDSTSAMELDAVPEHLLLLGGGYEGLEFGQMFRRLGAAVTIVEYGPALLGREDPDIAEAMAAILREDGVEVLVSTQATRVAPGEGGGISLQVRAAGETRTLRGSHLLVATGRRPNTDGLGLEAAGVATNRRGYITVDGRLATNVPGIYAIGDVNGGPAFTHISYDDFRILRMNMLEGGSATTEGRMVPYTVFTDPQLGRVGLSENEAKAGGRQYRLAKMPMSWVARALEVDEPRGLIKALVDPATDQVLGCAVLGIEGGELMAALQVAMMGRLPYTALRDAVFAHPTLAESLNNLFATLDG
jgi:pyruvate/2-oxoglutarate dehydrogenase complex dihydrolipoamide dehydrogenase (E3) component